MSMEVESIARKWGNSLGFIIPKEIVKKENIKPNTKIRFEIKRTNDISKTFGMLKLKMSGQEAKDSAREGWHD
jgi:antitoxin component of MazEF toxin-antitoxin module